MPDRKKIYFIITIFLSLITVGTIGYKFLLDVKLLDALYMTIITISTVGYNEIGVMTDKAKIFSMFIIFWGVGTVGYTLTTLLLMLLEGEIKTLWRKRRMENQITRLKGHYIICGGGETAEAIIDQFHKKNASFVVIEKDEERYEDLSRRGIYTIHGDAQEEEILERANITTARGLVSTMPNDSLNVFTVLTARQLNEKLYIISKAIDKSAPKKLKKAGADNTISSNEIGGRRMASFLLRPTVISFLDVVTQAGDIELDLEDVVVSQGSSIIGKTLKELRLPDKIGLIVIAVKKEKNEKLFFNPSSESILKQGDAMLVLGTEIQINKLREMARDDGDRLPTLLG